MQAARQVEWDTAVPAYRPTVRQPGRLRNVTSAPARGPLQTVQIVLFASLWIVVVSGALYYVHRQAEITQAGFTVAAARQQLAEAQSVNDALEARAAQLRSIGRIEQRAKEIGMEKPLEFRVATVDPSAVKAAAPEPAAVAPAARPQASTTLWARARDYLAALRLTTNTAEPSHHS